MPTREAEAVILRHYALSDADRIVVLLTREAGLLRAVAKGARRPKNRLGPCVQPLTHVRVEYYAREGSDLARLMNCEAIHAYLGRNPTLRQVYGFTYFAELVHEMSQENNPSPPVFRLLLAALKAGEKLGVGAPLVRYFELWLLRLNGLLPINDYCSGCGLCVKQLSFFVWPEAGQIRCPNCAQGKGVAVGSETAGFLRKMLEVAPEQFAGLRIPDRAAAEMESLSRRFVELNLEKEPKSYRLIRQALRDD